MFRRSGSFTTFQVEGSLPAVTDAEFARAMRKQRFQSIEGDAQEATVSGWVTAGDPTGETFEPQAIAFDEALWLRLRIDSKKLPARWLQIHRAEAEHSRGRKLSVKERRELREGLVEKLLPRVLPAVRFLDALVFPRNRRLLLFATSASARERFVGTVETTFGVRLRSDGPLGRAERTELPPELRANLRDLTPIEWRAAGPARRERAEVAVEVEEGA